jgi:DNA-binding NarL/FixJ family response regulator
VLGEEDLARIIASGARGFVPYERLDADLAVAADTVLRGGLWYPPRTIADSAAGPSGREHTRADGPVTATERRILDLLSDTVTDKELAASLGVSVRTVRFHLGNIFVKFGVHDRHRLVEAYRLMLQGAPTKDSVAKGGGRRAVTIE